MVEIISGEPWISATCQGELCRCGRPAVRKIGEEIAFDDPFSFRHNLTAYVCAIHFAEILGPAAARQVGLETTEENAMIPKETADLADELQAEFISIEMPLSTAG
jgi:hypothetical protein